MDTIKLKRATKSVANASTKVLEKDEVLVVTPDSGSGKGKCQLKFGDGITAAKSLPIAIDGENADEMKVSTIPTDSDENPVLSAGETVKVFFGKIKKKFTYLENLVGNVKSVTNLFGNTDAKTVAQGLQILVNTKLSKTDKYDGVDSTSTELWATANAVRKVNEKTDNNSTSIRELNSNLDITNQIAEVENSNAYIQQSGNGTRSVYKHGNLIHLRLGIVVTTGTTSTVTIARIPYTSTDSTSVLVPTWATYQSPAFLTVSVDTGGNIIIRGTQSGVYVADLIYFASNL
ncbi:hypothetical protein [Enterocloster bolteae]|jgi:hypothetical protein|uniref:hypothetical protein n=1 Tax=Enterocloster bolteae TaxID=208479 RepID=UPI001FADD03F|nr:hypothetical protein [Enterocloster bolteae]